MALDMSLAKAPKRNNNSPRMTKANKEAMAAEELKSARADGLKGMAQLLQFGLIGFRQYADAATVGIYGEKLCDELAELAETNSYIAAGTDFLIKAGPFAGLLAVVMPMTVQIMANHRLIKPASIPGVNIIPPEILEAQQKAELMRMQAEAVRKQQEAEREMREAMLEMQKAQAENMEPQMAAA